MRKLALYGIIIFQLLMIVSLIRGIQLSRAATNRIKEMENVKNKLSEEKSRLLQQEQYVQSEFYLEKVARDELHLSKEGETVVIVSENTTDVSKDKSGDQEVVDKPNWLKWWGVILGSN